MDDIKQGIKMLDIIESVCEWNEQRYPRVFNAKLTESLLKEEIKEAKAAKDRVELADAYADIFFVAVGAMWKRGLNAEPIEQRIFLAQQSKRGMHKQLSELAPLALVANNAVELLSTLAGSNELALDIIDVVCKSNHTKAIAQIDPAKKYGKEGKGRYYVSPTKAITTLLGGSND